jgi:hypothetical protein
MHHHCVITHIFTPSFESYLSQISRGDENQNAVPEISLDTLGFPSVSLPAEGMAQNLDALQTKHRELSLNFLFRRSKNAIVLEKVVNYTKRVVSGAI